MTELRPDHGGDEDTLKLVGFRIEDWRFAVRLEQVKTSIMPSEVTRVFHLPEYIKGIISLRGTMVGVLDLGALLGVTHTSTGFQRFLVVSGGTVQAAIPVHDVFRTPDVALSQVEAVPPSVPTGQRHYLEGIVNTSGGAEVSLRGEDTITLIDVAMVFESPALRELRGIL